MKYNISKPSVYLSQFVKNYWGLQTCGLPKIKHTHRIVPCGMFELIFYLDEKPTSIGATDRISDNLILSGQQKAFYDIEHMGQLSIFAIYFLPHGLSLFLDLPLNELLDEHVPLIDLFSEPVKKLEDELYLASSFEARVNISERFLLAQIKRKEKDLKFQRIRNAIESINRTKGDIDIDLLASEACLSRKQFERNFAEIVGSTPKQFLRIIRFQHAIHLKSLDKDLSLTQIAYSCGYFDQAHMINDFRSLSGLTPGRFFNNGEVISDYFI